MSENFKFELSDIARFAPVALKQASKKGSLSEIKKGNEAVEKFFVLCGNLLYAFAYENDPTSVTSCIFLESSVLKIVTNLGSMALSISTVGGKTILLSASNQNELLEWMEAIEKCKFKSLSRKLEDVEATSMQLHHRVEEQEVLNQEHERTYIEMKCQLQQMELQKQELEATISDINAKSRELQTKVRNVEKERQILMRSRGVTPKVLPLWALSEQSRAGVADMPEKVRIWTGTWNLGSCEPFAGMEKTRAQRLLQPFVPPGYQIYVLGVQDCISDSVFDGLSGLLEAEGCRRIRLDSNLSYMSADHYNTGSGGLSSHDHGAGINRNNSGSSSSSNSSSMRDRASVDIGRPSLYAETLDDGHHAAGVGNSSGHSSSSSIMATPTPTCTSGVVLGSGISSPGDLSKLVGRGDGSLLSMKYTGVAVYVHVDLLADVRLLSVTNLPLQASSSSGSSSAGSTSKGGVAVALSVMGRTIVFVCCQLDSVSSSSSSDSMSKEDQYRELMTRLGTQLAEPGFHLLEQFHHIIWCGDFSYSLVDTSGGKMPTEMVLNMLQDGRLNRTLFDTHDALNREKREKQILYGFREAAPFPDFYPTYKKVENRNPVDYTHPSWVISTYRTYTKKPFYKGGKIKEFTPSYADRIFYFSMVDLVEDLVPECVPVDIDVHKTDVVEADNDESTGASTAGHSSSSSSNTGRRRDAQSGTTGRAAAASVAASRGSLPKSMGVVIDNYRSVNDGEALNVSDHSPVYGTFVLRLRHDFEKLLKDSETARSVGSINTVLSALTQQQQQQQHPKQLEGEEDLSTSGNDMSAGGDGGREVVGGDGGREVEPTLPRNKSSAVSTLTSALQSGGHITTSRQEQQVEESKDSSNPTTSNNTGSGGFPKICKYSLLPPGTYRIRISNFKLVWGMNEEAPRKISLLFPAPFEAVAGERFVSVTPNAQIEAEAAAQQGGDDFVLSSVGSLGTGSGSGGGMGLTAGDLSYVTPTRNGATTVADSATGPGSLPSSHSAMMMVRHGEGAPHSAPRAGGDRPPPLPHDDSLTIQGAKSTRQYSSASSTTYGQQQHHEVTWDRVYNASRTGTSALLTTVPNHNHRRNITTTIASAPIPIQQSSNGHSSRSLISSSSQQQTSPSTIEPLVLTWRGAEPLDKLHVSLKVTMPAFSFNSGGGSSSRPTSTSKKSSRSTQSLSKAMSRSLGASSGNAAASEIVGAAAAGVDASACSHTTAALATTPTSSSRQQSSSSSARNSRNSSSTGNGGGGGGGGGNSAAVMEDDAKLANEDVITGHCAIGLEQLCKVAMVSTGGASGFVSVTRLLVNQGRPMHNIDAKSLQREMVTLCCSLELLPNVDH